MSRRKNGKLAKLSPEERARRKERNKARHRVPSAVKWEKGTVKRDKANPVGEVDGSSKKGRAQRLLDKVRREAIAEAVAEEKAAKKAKKQK